jgi:hypothetical protein
MLSPTKVKPSPNSNRSGDRRMIENKPRFEFRAWATEFDAVETRMRALSPCERVRDSDEIYIVSAANDVNNTKIRHGKMDIKVLVRKKDGLEQWQPRMKGEFPLSASILTADVLPAFGVDIAALHRPEYSLIQFLDEIVGPPEQLVAVDVSKKRFGFTVNDCMAEIAEVEIDGSVLKTVAVESVDVQAVLVAKEMLGLSGHDNVNYLRAIKRVVGLEC